jgi:isochorismate pyruvate lyase
MQGADGVNRQLASRQAGTARLDAPSMQQLTSPQTLEIQAPEKCSDMAEVRAGVDMLDAQLVALIARRFAYMDAAARIKDDRSAVRDEKRKAEVLGNVRRAALDQRIPQDVVAQIWESLIEGSIAYELERWDTLRG